MTGFDSEKPADLPALPLPTTLSPSALARLDVLTVGRLADDTLQQEVEALIAATPDGDGRFRLNWRKSADQNDIYFILVQKVGANISIIGTGKYDFILHDVAVGLSLDLGWGK